MQPIEQQDQSSPLLSFAVPLRNAEKHVQRLLTSLLDQDFSDFEIVISDNASDDRTGEICQEYARCHPCIRYSRNPENIGLNANFNRVLELARGKYVRWIGWDDWLEPDYARRCVEVLEANPHTIAVSTYQDFVDEDGSRDYVEYQGDRVDSLYVHKRYAQMLWFMRNDYRYFDPIYSMIHREVLVRIGGHKAILGADQVIAVELSLLGAFAHIPLCLSHRGKESFGALTRDQLLQQNYHNQYNAIKQQTYLDALAAFWAPVNKMPLSLWFKFLCLFPWLGLFLINSRREAEVQLKSPLKPVKRLLLRLRRLRQLPTQ